MNPDAPQGTSITFGRFTLDLERGCLLSDAREIPLRPNSFAVLTCLARRPGQIVSSEELLEAGWPGVVIPSDALEQSIAELRRSLGGAGARIITTVPGQGYRLDGDSAPPERRHSRRPLRWHWGYGLIAPIVLALAFAAIWFFTT